MLPMRARFPVKQPSEQDQAIAKECVPGRACASWGSHGNAAMGMQPWGRAWRGSHAGQDGCSAQQGWSMYAMVLWGYRAAC